MTPLPVTVIVPAHNRPAMTVRAVRSALAQRPFPPAEVLVIDDHSDDDTGAAARAAGARVVRHEVNLGEGAARNTGLDHASHEWVALLDSDDEWLPHHLDAIWPHREGHVLVAGSALRVAPDGRRRVHGPVSSGRAGGRTIGPADLMFPENLLCVSATMLRRDVAVEAGGFPPQRNGVDLDLALRVLGRGPGYAAAVVSVLYHVHQGQLSGDATAQKRAHRDLIADWARRGAVDPALVGKWEGGMAWDALRHAQRTGDRRTAVAQALAVARSPRRAAAVAETLVWRRRTRRAGARYAADGRESVAVLRRDEAVERSAHDIVGSDPVLPPDRGGRLGALARMAWSPPAAAVVESRVESAAVRALGVRPIRCTR